MSQAVFGLPIKKVYGETVSLTTTASHLLFRPGYHEVKFYCSTDWRLGIAPKLAKVVKYTSASTTYTDYSSEAIDRSDSTHVALDAMGTSDYLYLGVTAPTRGFYINVSANVNANAATLDFEYMSAYSNETKTATFSDVASDSDGTDSGGATLAQDGLYAFTLPAVVSGPIKTSGTNANLLMDGLFWYRFKPSATLSATIDLLDVIPACDTVNYGYEQGGVIENFSINNQQNGAFEFDHASTGTLYLNWIMH